MMKIFINLFLIQPVIEYFIHIYLHKSKFNNIHKKHHIEIHDKTYENNLQTSFNICLMFTPLLYFRNGYIILMGITKYQMIHCCLHIYPNIFSKLSKFHLKHHQVPNKNYGVTAMWPDKLFGTFI